MRAKVKAPAGLWRVVFDGQSLNHWGLIIYPDLTLGNAPFPDQLMSGRPEPWVNVAIGGQSWTTLATTAPTRVHRHAGHAVNTVLVMNGGTSDIVEGDSGQQLYDEEVAYANAARAAGYTHVIATTLVGNNGTASNAGREAARVAHNALLLADASDAFDGVADVGGSVLGTGFPGNPHYFDNLHWLESGATICANLVRPILNQLMGLGTSNLTFPLMFPFTFSEVVGAVSPSASGNFYDTTSTVAAINAATTFAGVQAACTPMAGFYGLEFIIHTTAGTAPGGHLPHQALVQGNVGGHLPVVKKHAIGWTKAMRQYPPAWFKKIRLTHHHVVGQIDGAGAYQGEGSWTGGANTGQQYAVFDGRVPDQQADPNALDYYRQRIIHHEYGHVIQNTPNEFPRNNSMMLANHPDHPYGGAWITAWDDNIRPPSHTGKIDPYRGPKHDWSSRIEQEEEMHAHLMMPTGNPIIEGWATADAAFDTKLDLWKAVIEYWRTK